MYHTSTQKQHWTFDTQHHVDRIRAATNAGFCQKHAQVAVENGCQFLTASEEHDLCQYYLSQLFEFCKCFRPPLPRSVMCTVAAYYKRFFLYTSVMEHHPKDIMYCCAYLAFKVDEYNVSIDEFIRVLLPEQRQYVGELVITKEMLILKKLNFYLTVHSPFRPLEGFIMDLKARHSEEFGGDIDQLRKAADSFLLKSLYTDVVMLYPPSQIALASLDHAAKLCNKSIDSYVRLILGNTEEKDVQYRMLQQAMASISDSVRDVFVPENNTTEIQHMKQRLEQCKVIHQISGRKRKATQLEGSASKRSMKEEPLWGFERL